ncbi:MAG: hypothetical protein IT330_05900 [Anaerolineae bacterium]|nr:hypothetical protein [Anaerolineae bacterium]
MTNKRIVLLTSVGIGALLLVAILVTAAFAQGPVGPGMMGRGGMMGNRSPVAPNVPVTSTYPYGCDFGPGMMGSGMVGMMGWGGPGMMGPEMMGGFGAPWARPNPNAERLTGEEVQEAVANYLATYYDNPDLEIAEIMEFEYNFYAQVREKSTEINAFELLIDPYTGFVWPEYGPNMMWNTKYGHMGGMGGMMMYGWGGQGNGQPTADMPVTPEEATRYAQEYLKARNSGLTAGEPETFYGYYTLHTSGSDGEPEGMLSVNGYTGRVWYHAWHGRFLGMVSEEEH